MHNEFTAIVERDEEWFIAYSPEIPGANGQGKTKEEAKLLEKCCVFRHSTKYENKAWNKGLCGVADSGLKPFRNGIPFERMTCVTPRRERYFMIRQGTWQNAIVLSRMPISLLKYGLEGLPHSFSGSGITGNTTSASACFRAVKTWAL